MLFICPSISHSILRMVGCIYILLRIYIYITIHIYIFAQYVYAMYVYGFIWVPVWYPATTPTLSHAACHDRHAKGSRQSMLPKKIEQVCFVTIELDVAFYLWGLISDVYIYYVVYDSLRNS